jgi:hypothetical protein
VRFQFVRLSVSRWDRGIINGPTGKRENGKRTNLDPP